MEYMSNVAYWFLGLFPDDPVPEWLENAFTVTWPKWVNFFLPISEVLDVFARLLTAFFIVLGIVIVYQVVLFIADQITDLL